MSCEKHRRQNARRCMGKISFLKDMPELSSYPQTLVQRLLGLYRLIYGGNLRVVSPNSFRSFSGEDGGF